MAKVNKWPKRENSQPRLCHSKAPGSREGSPVSSVLSLLPHHQPIMKTTHPAAPAPDFAYKNSPQITGEFRGVEPEPSTFLAWPDNKPFSAPNSDIFICLASLCVRHTNLCSITDSKCLLPKIVKAFIVQVGIVKFEMTKDPYNRFS